jgi:hypothetical protein
MPCNVQIVEAITDLTFNQWLVTPWLSLNFPWSDLMHGEQSMDVKIR